VFKGVALMMGADAVVIEGQSRLSRDYQPSVKWSP